MNRDDDSSRANDLFVEAFARGLTVIKAFGPGRAALTLSEVAESAGVTPAGARRLLHTLVTLGYARMDGRRFSLTPAVLDIGYSYLGSLSLREIAPPLLEAFARDVGEICTVSVLDRTDVVYVARTEMRSPLSRRLVTGERLPAHATSSGHVLLGQLTDGELASYLEHGPFEKFTRLTLTQPAQLARAIARARKQGYALASEQLELGICGLAVPVHDRAGMIAASLTTSLNLAKHKPDSILPKFLSPLSALASEIGSGLAA